MASNSKFMDVEEQYISPVALAKENICGWIKWNENIDCEKILLRCESDVKISMLFDVDETDEIKVHEDGTLEIPKSALQLNGFFGFRANYETIPESKKDVRFSIDFVNKENIETVTLETSIDRPHVQMVDMTSDRLILSDYSPIPQPLSFDIVSTGDVMVNDPELNVDIFGKQIQIKINDTQNFPKLNYPFNEEIEPQKEIMIRGTGNGLMKFSLKYNDPMGNEYTTLLHEMSIIIEGKQSTTIPFGQKVSSESPLLLVTH